jgi:outer membrane receptor protein involved in Fe transport
MKKIVSNILILFSALSISVFAQTGVGKLSGVVTDAATKEPLIGANVVILNTQLGAATNIKGEYFVLNITPGTYDVQFTYLGFAKRIVKEVRVVAGITYELNMELSTDLTLPEVIVEGKRFFESKSTNTTKVLDANDINKMPVKGVENLASMNAGVVISEGSGGASGNANINVRGGRSGEVLYIVDGVPQNDVYTGANYSQVSNAAIEQLSFQIGGYEAKYGQAQSGIVNVTTKSGSPDYSLFTDLLSSSFTDDYGYNLYTGTFSGPIIPGDGKNVFFLSGERGWYADGNPRAVGIEFKSLNPIKSSNKLPNTESGIWRFTGRTTHYIGDFTVRLSANINFRDFRGYIHTYSKANSEHNTRTKRGNYSFSGKISQQVSSNSFWNLNLGMRLYEDETGDGVWFNDLEAYGDSIKNAAKGVTLKYWGYRIPVDANGIFALYGRVNNGYNRTKNQTFTGDIDFTTQIGNHLLEVGGGAQYNTLRFFAIGPLTLATDAIRSLPNVADRYRRLQPTVFGFDVTGKTTTNPENPAKNPLLAYAYVQDRFELSDMVLNVGLRFDYFDTKADIIRNPYLPYAYGDPSKYDNADFETKKAEFNISPRIGLGFPVTENTVFHAQYGKFIQQPSLNQLYTTIYDLNFLITDNNWGLNTGHVSSEVTTQYEIGFRQVLANMAALNITAFYKNTKGLVNSSTTFFQRVEGGELLRYITPTNTDFGTVKGLAISVDVSKVSYFSLSLDYTYSIAEGTGSSTGSSFTAAFRNTNGEIPKVIAPLDFDQRHTGVLNVDFAVPKGDLGFLEMLSANLLFRFNSGRPYTPLEDQNLLAGNTNYGDTKGYVNSAYGPGNFRVDLKLEKSFALWNATITPYVWIENLFDSDNPVTVYQATGDPYTTGYLSTPNGQKDILDKGEGWKQDYISLERNPFNFGIPRLIKVGFKVNFAKIEF